MTDLALPPAPMLPPRRPGQHRWHSQQRQRSPVATPMVTMEGELEAHVAELPALATLQGPDRVLAAAWLAGLAVRGPAAPTPRICWVGKLGWASAAWPCCRKGGCRRACGSVPNYRMVPGMPASAAAVGDRVVLPLLPGPRPNQHRPATVGVARPRVDPDYTATVSLSREQSRALIAAVDTDGGRSRLRSAAIIRVPAATLAAAGASSVPAGETRECLSG